MNAKIIYMVPFIILFFAWVYFLYLLHLDYNFNLIAMFNSSNDLYWRGFILISIAFSLFLASLLLGFNKEDKDTTCEEGVPTEEK